MGNWLTPTQTRTYPDCFSLLLVIYHQNVFACSVKTSSIRLVAKTIATTDIRNIQSFSGDSFRIAGRCAVYRRLRSCWDFWERAREKARLIHNRRATVLSHSLCVTVLGPIGLKFLPITRRKKLLSYYRILTKGLNSENETYLFCHTLNSESVLT